MQGWHGGVLLLLEVSNGVMRINPVRYPVVRTAAAVDNPVHMMKVEIINSFNIPYVQDLVG